MNFGNFATNVAANAGRSLIIGQELDAQKSQTDLRNAEVAESRARMAQMAQTTQMKKAVGDFITGKMAEDKASIEDPAKAAQVFAQAATMALSKGDFATAREMDVLAHDKAAQAKERRTELAAEIQTKREGLARAAQTFAASGNMMDATEVAKAAIAAGVNPLDIPPPNTPEFKAWAKKQEVAAMSSKEVLAAEEKKREFEEREARLKKEDEWHHQEAEARRKQTAAFQNANLDFKKLLAEGMKAEREGRKEERQGHTAFLETEKLSKEAQHTAEPLLKDLETTANIKNLLHTDSPVADQQIRQALPALLGGLKGRATNPYYKDSVYFGNLVQKGNELFSRAFTGRYSEQTRKQIGELVDNMQKNLLEPGLTRIERDAKAKAAKYKLDPDLIELQGDFTRRDPKPVRPEGSWGGAGQPPAAGTTRELNGKTYFVNKDGKWEEK